MFSEGEIKLELATPQKLVTSETIAFVTLPGAEGEIAILPRRAPIILSLKAGLIKVYALEGSNEKVIKSFVISNGIANVNENVCHVIADFASPLSELNKDSLTEKLKALNLPENPSNLLLTEQDYLKTAISVLD